MTSKTYVRRLAALLVLAASLAFPVPASAQLFITTAMEIRLGQSAAKELEGRYGVWTDPAQSARVAEIGGRLAAVSERTDLTYRFKILNDPTVNAVALPGGFVYLFRGLLPIVQSDDELAFVLGHEIGHVVAKHGVKRLEGAILATILIRVVLRDQPDAQTGAAVLQLLLDRGFSREQELESDRRGVTYMARAGFRPAAALDLIRKFLTLQKESASPLERLLATHPLWQERYETLAVVIAGLR